MKLPFYTNKDRTVKAYTVQHAINAAYTYLRACGWGCAKLPALPPRTMAITLEDLNTYQAKVVAANWGRYDYAGSPA